MGRELLIVCPNEEKMNILNSLTKDTNFHSIKFMTKEEYLSNYYFSYNEEALYYLIKKYNYNLDVAKNYLNNLMFIDENKEYHSNKLSFLKELKKELTEKGLLIFHPGFHEFLKDKEIKVINYYDLDKFEEQALNCKIELSNQGFTHNVIELASMEDEINYVCIEIKKLIESGIDINKIILCNVSSDYLYTIDRLFSYYKIPINIDFKDSVYSTKIVTDYLKNKNLDLNNKNAVIINKKLVNILGKLSNLTDDEIREKILIDKLKSTYLKSPLKYNAVNIKDLYKTSFNDDEYVFVIGFNQDSLPRIKKDLDFIDDSIKDEVSLYKTEYLNKRSKEVVSYLLSNIKNLYLSYKLSSPFQNYYKSSLIDDLGLKIIKKELNDYTHSNSYNKLRLAEMLDNFRLFGEKDSNLEKLNSKYKIPYNTYTNLFTGIDNDTYLKNLPYPLHLSYTSLNCYNECKFKYFIKYVLSLDEYTDSFSSFVGSLYHKILSLFQNKDFNFEEEYQKYLTTRELTLKEKILLVRIKKELLEFLETIKKQNLLTSYDEALYEAKATVPLKKDVAVEFVGYIDKIMFYKNIEDTYFSIIDYKTGYIDTHIEPIKYGLHMQLPVYLYLINYSKLFSNPIFTGIYYQNILFNYPSWNENIEKEKKSRYLLNGYSTDNIEHLSRFDSTYQASELIKSMKFNEEKGFGTYSKTLSDDTLYDLIKYTKRHIDLTCDDILNSDFQINPKNYDGDNISCEYCQFRDLCYMRESNLIYYDKVKDLSFLGGEE